MDNLPNYKQRYYEIIKLTINKKVVIDKTLDRLHEMQLDMIDEAVKMSDLQQANDIIKTIKSKI